MLTAVSIACDASSGDRNSSMRLGRLALAGSFPVASANVKRMLHRTARGFAVLCFLRLACPVAIP